MREVGLLDRCSYISYVIDHTHFTQEITCIWLFAAGQSIDNTYIHPQKTVILMFVSHYACRGAIYRTCCH